MALRIEDYALIGDTQTAALVGRDGSIDWLCLPRFDSPRLLRRAARRRPSTAAGCSRPPATSRRTQRRYRDDTLVLETEFETADGRRARRRLHAAARRGARRGPHRRGRARAGARCGWSCVIRFDYGSRRAVGAPRRGRRLSRDRRARTRCACARRCRPAARTSRRVAEFAVGAGRRACRSCSPGTRRTSRAPAPVDAGRGARRHRGVVARSGRRRCTYDGPRGATPVRALADHAQGADLRADRRHRRRADHLAARAARRRAQLGLPLLLAARRDVHALRAAAAPATRDEARAWRDWLLRAVAGRPGAAADHVRPRRRAAADRARARLAARLRGLGAGAHRQRRRRPVPARRLRRGAWTRCTRRAQAGLEPRRRRLARCSSALLEFLERRWDEPDEGIWEVRGPRRHFTHSKVMAWVAFDRAVQGGRAVRARRPGRALARSCATRSTREVCREGLRRRAQHVRPVLRRRRSSTPACC